MRCRGISQQDPLPGLATRGWPSDGHPSGWQPFAKPKRLSLLYLDAAAEYWGAWAERLEREGRIGPGGLVEADLAGVPEFDDLDEFRSKLEAAGVPFKE